MPCDTSGQKHILISGMSKRTSIFACDNPSFHGNACDQTSGTGVQVEQRLRMHIVHMQIHLADGMTLQTCLILLAGIAAFPGSPPSSQFLFTNGRAWNEVFVLMSSIISEYGGHLGVQVDI